MPEGRNRALSPWPFALGVVEGDPGGQGVAGYRQVRNSDGHDEEMWKQGYCTILPELRRGDPLNIIKVILQWHIIEDRECTDSPELDKDFESVPEKLPLWHSHVLWLPLSSLMAAHSGTGWRGEALTAWTPWKSGDRWNAWMYTGEVLSIVAGI